MKQFAILCVFLGSIAVYANSSKSHSIVSLSDQKVNCIQPTDSLGVLLPGALIFGSSCHSCHTTIISHAYDSVGWSSIISRMSINAGLDSTQTAGVSEYIFDQLSKTDTSYTLRTVGGYRQW